MKPSSFQTALDLLRKGEAVAVPTETVYGLAADISVPSAIEKIFSIKKRPFFDPLIVHVCSIEQIGGLVSEVPAVCTLLMKEFWPGPITFVLPKRPSVNNKITSGLNTVGVRMPNHPVTLELIRQLGSPVAAPSANLFGHTSPTNASHVRDEFGESVFVLDGGPCLIGVESTVVGFRLGARGAAVAASASGDAGVAVVASASVSAAADTEGSSADDSAMTETGEVVIYRPGGISREELENFLSRRGSNYRVVVEQSPVAPGHLKHHYMPKIPLVIITQPLSETSALPEMSSTQRSLIERELKLSDWKPIEMKLNPDANLAARDLYSELRRCGESGCTLILLQRSLDHNTGLWSAIWNRLERAATLVV